MSSPWDKEKKKKPTKSKGKGKGGARKVDEEPMETFDPNMLDLWAELEEDQVDDYAKFQMDGVYGDWNTGKSAYALSYPAPIWYIDTEDGLKKILTPAHVKRGLKHMNLKKETKKMVELTGRIHKRNRKKEIVVDAEVLFHRLQIAVSGVLYQLEKDPDQVGTVVIDDGGHLKKAAWEWRVDAYGEWETATKQAQLDLGLGGSKAGIIGEGWDNARSWANATQKATSIYELLKGQDCNTVVLSKIKKIEDQATGMVTEEANWHRSTPGLCDNVIHLKRSDQHGFQAVVQKVRRKGEYVNFNKTYSNNNFGFNYEKLRSIVKDGV